jgi:hypothetical protein
MLILIAPTGAASAIPSSYDIQLSGCRDSDGTYTATVTAYNDGSFWTHLHIIDEYFPPPWGTCAGDVMDGWTQTYTGLSEGSEFSAFYLEYAHDVRTITLDSALPSCAGSGSGAKPLFDMYLLTGGGKYCILVSNSAPSVASQKTLCFPGQDWVADQVLCKATLYRNDYWSCDEYGKDRLHVDDLMRYYERHKLPEEADAPAPASTPNA